MTSSNFETFGALTLPTAAGDVTDTLAPFDPGRDVLLALFKQAIISELGAAWNAVVTPTVLAGKSIVQHALPLEPSPQVVKALQLDYPLLCVYRTGDAEIETKTLDIEWLVQPWRVDYILGPLPPEDQRRLSDVLTAVAKVILITTERRGHPDYAGGALQFFGDSGAFADVTVKGYELGRARFDGGDSDTIYHAMSLRLQTAETRDARDGYTTVPLQGASFTVGVGDDDEILPDLIIADTDAAQ